LDGNIVGVTSIGDDITGRRITGSRLRESESKFRDLVAKSLVGVYLIQDGIFKYCNQRLAEIFGYTTEELINKKGPENLVFPEDWPIVRDNLQKRVSGEIESIHYGFRGRTKNNKTIYVEVYGSRTDFQGKPAVIGSLLDVTERKKTEDKLKASEEKYQSLIHNIPVVTWMTDSEGNTEFISPNIKEVYGYTPEEIYEKGDALWFGRIHPNDRDSVKKAFQDLFEKGSSFYIEYRIQRKDNIWIWLSDRAVKVFQKDGKSYAYGIFSDITERKKVEEELTKSAFYLDSAGDAIIVINAEQEIMKVNKEVTIIWGYTPKEVLGKSIFDFLPEKERSKHKAEMEKAVATKLPRSFETFALTKDGREVPLSIRGSAIFNQNGEIEGFIGSFRDVTELKKAEAEREDLLKELLIKNKELGQLIYVTSHDLRTPMVNIQGFIKELAQSIEELKSVLKKVNIPEDSNVKLSTLLDRDIKESKEFIIASITKMDTLLTGLLRVSRLGRVELNKEKIDMNRLIAEVTDTLEFQLKKFGIELDISELPPCTGDKMQINQVFSNLIDNALKYMNPERAGIINISGYLENGHSVYCVEDNGIGIEREHQNKVFELFHQLEPGTDKGEGLGLTIVQKVIEKHDGNIWLESERGKGSRFYVSLPA
jgi:PAS domain S-box-containing protein